MKIIHTSLLLLLFLFHCAHAQSVDLPVRIKDLVEIRGVRSNQLTGLGLVIGLQGTGDSKASIATNKAASSVISRLGIAVSPAEVTTKNVAVVVVTSDLPPFARVGDKIDLRISSIGDAASLEGGTLLLTTLNAADDRVYATAQGSISQGTAMSGAQGGGGQSSQNSTPKTVSLANAGIVEREYPISFIKNNAVELSLRNEDFTTASRIALAVNNYFGEFIANAVNGGVIKVNLPNTVDKNNQSFNPVAFMAALEQVKVTPDTQAIIVINERTGTIISGNNVIISPVAISHGRLDIQIGKKSNKVTEISAVTTVGDLVKALNNLGAGPKDVVSILQSLEAAKALKAQLKLM
ncbi:MAG: flagellar basal body P-ring protein FlgI [Bdellovibrionota bacterium]